MRVYTLSTSLVVSLSAISIAVIFLIPGRRHPPSDLIVASCGDFVEVTRGVFTGREGVYFTVNGVRTFLGGGTFGPKALQIGGVDPAVYLEKKCR